MKIIEYRVKEHVEYLNKIFLQDYIMYTSKPFEYWKNNIKYGRKIFDAHKNYLGIIDDDIFDRNVVNELK